MPMLRQETIEGGRPAAPITLGGADKSTLAAVFRRQSRPDLDWRLVVGLMETIGKVEESGHGELLFEVAGMAHLMRKPDINRLDATMVSSLRQFLALAGWTPQAPPTRAVTTAVSEQSTGLMIVVDEQGARLFHVDLAFSDPAGHAISSGDPRIFLQHLAYTVEPRTLRQRTPSDNEFFGKITAAVAARCTIFVVSEGSCISEAADRLIAFLRLHHPGKYKRVVCPTGTALSSATPPALLLLLVKALR